MELGGTGCKIALYKEADNGLEQVFLEKLETSQTDAEITCAALAAAGRRGLAQVTGNESSEADSLGVASFGPVCLDQTSPAYGNITSTPKMAWQNFPVLTRLAKGLGFDSEDRRKRVFFDTDVNVPAMFEFTEAKARQDERVKESLCYVTVGTGIGIGLIINGKCVHGMMHPEGGHVRIPISPKEQSAYGGFAGVCPFHGNCLEGLCTNVAIKERLGLQDVSQLADLADDNEVWDLVGTYLGDFCANLFLTVSVERIIIGGGVCSRAILMDKIRARFLASLNDYVQMP